MRYISLYEAFESSTLSKIVRYLTKKVNKDESKKFVNSLKKLKSIYDFPIDKISDDVVEYISAKKALKIKSEEDISNPWQVSCIKFWFSLDKGYIGYTGVGDRKMDFNRYRGGRNNTDYFDIDDINYIKDTLDIKTGRLEKLLYDDYPNIQQGDQFIGFFNEERRREFLSKAKMFMDGDQLFAIQDVASGSSPDYQYITRDELNWRDWGRYSWSIGDKYSPNSDHRCLYKYTPSNNPLSIEGFDDDYDKTSPFDFNLPMNSNGLLVDWGRDSYSLNGKNWESIENSDFCIVLYLDNMMDPDKASFYEKPSEIKKQRYKDREGALKLMSDKEIKEINIDRYLSKIISTMGFSKDKIDLKKLEKIISMSICGEYSLFSIYSNGPDFSYVRDIQGRMYELILAVRQNSDVEYYYKRFADLYKSLSSSANGYKKFISNNYNTAIKSLDDDPKQIIELIFDISKYIKKYIDDQDIKTIEDYTLLYSKLVSIRDVINNNLFKPNRLIIRFLNDIKYLLSKSEIDDYIESMNSYNLDGDLKKIKMVEKYIKSILN